MSLDARGRRAAGAEAPRLNWRRVAASLRYRGGRAVRLCLSTGLDLCERLGAAERVAASLRRGLWEMNRSYRPAEARAALPREFSALLYRVAAGESATAAELLPYLCLERRAARAEVNALLADAYAQRPTAARLRQAKVFADRAWLLSGFAPELLPLYAQVSAAVGDTAGLREAYKRLGLDAARRGDLGGALAYFDQWQYAYYTFEKVDRFAYDFDILSCVEELAAARRHLLAPSEARRGDRVRLAYLIKGIVETNSILVKINLDFAKFHDPARFEVAFFTTETAAEVARSPQGAESVAKFESLGCRVVTAPEAESTEARLVGLARSVAEWGADIFVVSAGLASFEHYFLTCLRPAPIVVGLIQGPPAQYAPPALDWAIAWSKHPLMDAPVDCSLVGLKLEQAGRAGVEPIDRTQLGLPREARVLMSGGRHVKFQDESFWRAIAAVLAAHTSAHYVVVGASQAQLPLLDALFSPELRARVHCLGWRDDFRRLLGAADVLIDTYPNGGGQVLVEAMVAGVPVVAHQNDYLSLFDQTQWSPVEDFISDPELIVPRGDFARFREVLGRLIEDEEFRREAGARCRREVEQAGPEPGVRRCEEVYASLLGGGPAFRE